jgi:hypothetical protein
MASFSPWGISGSIVRSDRSANVSGERRKGAVRLIALIGPDGWDGACHRRAEHVAAPTKPAA